MANSAAWVLGGVLAAGAYLIYAANRVSPGSSTTHPVAHHSTTHSTQHPATHRNLAPPEPTYTVPPSYNLSLIAQKVYGDASLWPALYLANLSVIGKNPNLIQPGMVLHIPPLADARVLAQAWYAHAHPTQSAATTAQQALQHLLVVPNPVPIEG